MAENKHTINELKIMQAYPLWLKIEKTKRRIQEWVEYWGLQNVAVSFSGGENSRKKIIVKNCEKTVDNGLNM